MVGLRVVTGVAFMVLLAVVVADVKIARSKEVIDLANELSGGLGVAKERQLPGTFDELKEGLGVSSGRSEDDALSLNWGQPIRGPHHSDPKQLHLEKPIVKEFMPGQPIKKVGYPRVKVSRDEFADRLYNTHPENPEAPGTSADDPIYPGDGVMNAEDAHQLSKDLGPVVDQMLQGDKGEQLWADKKSEIELKRMKLLTQLVNGGPRGVGLLSGAIDHQAGIATGNMHMCMDKLKECKQSQKDDDMLGESGPDLGEGTGFRPEDMDSSMPTHTATEDYRMRNGISHPAEHIRQKPATQQETQTAHEEYVDSQKSEFWRIFEGEPGFKMPWDKMSKLQVDNMLKSAAEQIRASQQMTQQEAAMSLKDVKDSIVSVMSAVASEAGAKDLRRKLSLPPTTQEVLRKLEATLSMVKTCEDHLHQTCPTMKFRAAQPAVPMMSMTGEETLASNPENDSTYSDPDEDGVREMPYDSADVVTRDGGSAPQTKGESEKKSVASEAGAVATGAE